MGANVKMSQAMAETSKAQMAKTMQEFNMANTKMGMTEEMMNDALDDILTESGDEEEGDLIVNQVLDEIGIEISGKVRIEIFFVFLGILISLFSIRCHLLHLLPKELLGRRQFQRRIRRRTMRSREC